MEFDFLHIALIVAFAAVVFLSQRLYQSVPREIWERTNDELDKAIEALPEHQERIVRVVVDAILTLLAPSIIIEDDEDLDPRG